MREPIEKIIQSSRLDLKLGIIINGYVISFNGLQRNKICHKYQALVILLFFLNRFHK